MTHLDNLAYLIEKLHKILYNGIIIKNQSQTFQVKINGFISSIFKQENCATQGFNILVTLLIIAINDLCEIIKFPLKSFLYSDDLNIWCRRKSTKNLHLLQNTLSSFANWSAVTGNRLFTQKSQNIIFTH